jgi:thiol-disulfide isomerase/thioredoxin
MRDCKVLDKFSSFASWCEDCRKQKKLERKRRRRQEEQKRYYERFAQEQNELLENARLQMLQQISCNPFLVQIDNLAKQMATNYLCSHTNDGVKVSFEVATLIYKILVTPTEFLSQMM